MMNRIKLNEGPEKVKNNFSGPFCLIGGELEKQRMLIQGGDGVVMASLL